MKSGHFPALVAAGVIGAATTAAVMLVGSLNDRKHAQEALRASEQNLRLIPDCIPAFIHTLTPQGEVEHVNQRIVEFFGLSAPDLRDWRGVTHPDDVDRVGAVLKKCLQTGETVEFESRGRRADGVFRWFQARGTPMRDGDGKIVRWYFSLADIDDRRHAEDALRASEHHLRLMVESIPGLICTSTAAGEVEYVNTRLLDFTGRSLEELRNWPIVVHADDLPTVAELWQRSITTGVPFNVEVRMLRADGVYRWFQCNGLPLRAEDGTILRWYNLLTDIEDRKLAEERLRSREKELELIIETLPAYIWCASPEGELIYVNRRVLEYTGCTFAQLAGASFDHIHPDDRQVIVDAWVRSAQTGSPYETQYRKRRADGSFRWVQSIGRLGRDEQGRAARWYGLFIDIDERVKAEEALRDTRSRLARATQVATVGELSAAVAHEINQPLAAVIANAHACHSWLTANPPNMPRALVTIERIIRDGKSAADVIQRIRALYRQAPPGQDLVSVNEVIGEICRLIEPEMRRRSIVLNTHLAPGLPPILADRVQIQQVLSNLTRNAMEAMEPVTDGPRELYIASLREERSVVIRIHDTGIGMHDFRSAFEPFFTTKPNGMGMGLAICRTIVEAHGGRLWAARPAAKGSVFSFSLPVAPNAIEEVAS
ncbi:MAG: PAS domain S-box protein [Gammaproteobacteria bacterium]